MISILVKGLETKAAKEAEELREENAIIKFLLKEYVKKTIDYKQLLEERLELLDRYQEEVENLGLRTDMWIDEVTKQYFIIGDLDKALNLTGREIMLYELNKNKGEM
ncbi:hypothetical protein RSJ22_12275 [Clostridium botulinum]|uniref:hypothetical protein n=1 Tax=Clostridium botulinum TaxID=1491 RepID=UPI0004664489|nr:hypothetical protein [Clostridium botulinum]APQ71822.1 hypothetical protein RSJ9_2718 [Clostridium botulinum]AUN22175.1 hypothetical protein RSJ22_12275 [Clostridium botulinum]QDY21649.1 hypothetical protein CGQ39_12025 [Clostridium botulinum]